MNSKKYYTEKRNSFSDAKERNIKEYSHQELDQLNIKNIHFVAVCGKAMASLAGMLVEAGYNVTGSDSECYPPMSDVVAESGICYFDGFKKENIENADVVIVGNACPVSNIEAEQARKIGKPQMSVASALNYFCIKNKKSIVVTGTHGKTTTTSYIAETIDSLERGTSYLVGGVLKKNNKSYSFNKNSKYIVVEGDEYDSAYFDKRPKFFHYDPYVLIVTSIEFDHADIYKDFEEYKLAFKMLLDEKKQDGVVIACIDDVEVKNIIENYSGELITYGIENDSANLNVKNLEIINSFQAFDVFSDGEFYAKIQIPIFGNHNIRNSLSVLGTLKFLGFSKDEIVSKMKDFSGVKQRQEVLSIKGDIIVVDDYAHHPTAVKETLFGLKNQYPDRRLISVFEPRSTTSRKKIYENDYAKSFYLADFVIIKEPNIRTQDNLEDILSTQNICDYLVAQGKEAFSIKTTDEIVLKLKEISRPGDVVVFMSNGSFDEIQQKFIDLI